VDWHDIKAHVFDFILMGVINIAIPWMLISWAEQFTDSGTAAILNGTMPLFTIVLSPIFNKDDRITLPKIGGLLIGFLGVVILMSPSVQGQWTNDLLGQVAIILASVSYASTSVFVRKKMRGVSSPILSLFQMSAGAIIIWMIALITEKPMMFPSLPITWFALVWLGLLGSCIAFIIYFSLLHEIGPTRASMVTYIPPLVGMILGVGFLGETFYWQSLLGSLLIISGIAIVNSRKKETAKAA
jgi:drug/metabolite transporter (DMT)-like permease